MKHIVNYWKALRRVGQWGGGEEIFTYIIILRKQKKKIVDEFKSRRRGRNNRGEERRISFEGQNRDNALQETRYMMELITQLDPFL